MLLTISSDATTASWAGLVSDAYGRLGRVSSLVRIVAGPPERAADGGGSWTPADRMAAEPDRVAALVDGEARHIHAAYGAEPRRDVAATWALERYLFTAALAFSAPWFLERRVPAVPLDRIGYAWQERSLAVAPVGVACLPGDPAAALPGARTAPDEEALRAELRDTVARHAAPVLEAFGPLVRRRSRALWALATDQLASGIMYMGRSLGEASTAASAANALLPGSTAPYQGAADLRPSPDPEIGYTRTRTGCCLYYTLPPGSVCSTCPRAARR
ncbi:(2Fe-2S)-binding protein [Streptomyces sp. NPDC088729]|uniref:(2Fe-2S)-binding protein n=1 Tax=Streptomyces sp. NPDC088729 TaxID=3365876 RepID=UPI00381EF34A